MPSIGRYAVKLLKSKIVRSSTQTSLAASTAIPDSGFDFVHNLQGASAALQELSDVVSSAIEYIELKDGPDGGLTRSRMETLEEAIGNYANADTDAFSKLSDWNCDNATAELINAAFKCAAAVYGADPKSIEEIDPDDPMKPLIGVHRKPESAGISFQEIEYLYPSAGGSSKAIGFWRVNLDSGVVTNSRFPALIVAVRGTEKFIDHLVNANSRPSRADDFFNLSSHDSLRNLRGSIKIHSGFLKGAQALVPIVLRLISGLGNDGAIKNVIFTGHSAGGAVAALLYLKFLFDPEMIKSDMKFSSITFGAPPVLGTDIMDSISQDEELNGKRYLNLAFVNEFDMICRIDQSYLRSLVDLIRSLYNLEPVMSENPMHQESSSPVDLPFHLPPLEFQEKGHTMSTSSTDETSWQLLKAEYHVFGNLVLLRREVTTQAEFTNTTSKRLRALIIKAQDFEQLLYCGLKTHSRIYYDDRINYLVTGHFNSLAGWDVPEAGR